MNNAPAEIRKFIIERFSDGELENLCFDYFPTVYNEFTLGMPKGQKARLLLGFCRRERLHDLIAAIE